MSQVSPDSYGVAQALVANFLPKFAACEPDGVEFYGEGAVLYYQGTQASGKEEIAQFFSARSPISLNVTGWEVQTVPGSDLWSMVVVIGSFQDSESRRMASFHSAFYVESRKEDHTAFIRYHAFNVF